MTENRKPMEADLMRKVASGDTDAFEEILAAYRPMVRRLATLILAHSGLRGAGGPPIRDIRADVDDITQETFVRIWQKAGTFNPDFRLATWIRTIVCNRCLDKLRKDRWLVFFSRTEVPEPDPRSDTDRTVEGNETRDAIAAAVSRLSPKQRVIFILREIEKLSTEEIQAITGQSPNQIKSNLHLAKRSLRLLLAGMTAAILFLLFLETRPAGRPQQKASAAWRSGHFEKNSTTRRRFRNYLRARSIRETLQMPQRRTTK